MLLKFAYKLIKLLVLSTYWNALNKSTYDHSTNNSLRIKSMNIFNGCAGKRAAELNIFSMAVKGTNSSKNYPATYKPFQQVSSSFVDLPVIICRRSSGVMSISCKVSSLMRVANSSNIFGNVPPVNGR